jgi:hypothetical protein
MGDKTDRTRNGTPDGGGPPPAGPQIPNLTKRQIGDVPALKDFRDRVDQFWAHPKAAELKRKVNQDRPEPRRLAPVSALRSRQQDTIAIIKSRLRQDEYRLQKGLTYRDGRLVSLWGDEQPLAPDDRLLVVTTTTTIMDSDSLEVETNVLVFERDSDDDAARG